MAGRRPKSRVLKLLHGNPGKRKLRDDEPEAVSGRPNKPTNLLTKVGSAKWDELASLLESEHRLTISDGPMLDGAALAWQSMVAAIKGKCARDARMQLEHYRKFCNDLCLSQGTRARAKTIGKPPQSKLRAFIGGRDA